MKVEAFVKVLRKVIREEVRQVVKEELKSIKPSINERQSAVPTKKTAPIPNTQRGVTKNYTTIDSALNNILKETADNMRSRPSEEYQDWPEMDSGFGTTNSIAGFGQATPDFFENEMSTGGHYPMSNDPTAAFMKDYSNVLKSAEQKSQGYRG